MGKYFSSEIDIDKIWLTQDIDAFLARKIEELSNFVWEHFQNPTVPGVNVGQWCKKEECWDLLKLRYENQLMVNKKM